MCLSYITGKIFLRKKVDTVILEGRGFKSYGKLVGGDRKEEPVYWMYFKIKKERKGKKRKNVNVFYTLVVSLRPAWV